MPQPPATSPRRVLTLGLLAEPQAQVMIEAGVVLHPCAHAYDLAATLAREGSAIRAVCVAPSALGPQVGKLALLLKRLRPDLGLWLPPGAKGQRADLAVNLGFQHWETVFVGSAAQLEKTPTTAPASSPPAPPTGPLPTPSGPPAAAISPTSERVGPIREAEPEAEPPIVVRMPPKPTRADLAAQVKADNAKAEHAGTSNIEAEMAARYDALSGDPLLTDEELKALLDDSGDGQSPEEPPHR